MHLIIYLFTCLFAWYAVRYANYDYAMSFNLTSFLTFILLIGPKRI